MRFSDIIGHKAEIERLRNMVDDRRVPHALLLSGKPGIGKLMLARALAQYMHCTNRVDGDSCGRCEACLQHQSFNHPDMKFVYPVVKSKAKHVLVSDDVIADWKQFMNQQPFAPYEKWLEAIDAGNSQPMIYVDESNALSYKMNLSNYSAEYKVVLFWLPEKMNEEAANKLLKLIEEPNADTRFIFVSNEPQLILPTIFSRTQSVELRPPSSAIISGWLQKEYALDKTTADEVARICEGNIPMAVENISYGTESGEFRENFQNMMRMAYARDIIKMRVWSETLAAWGRDKLCRYLNYVVRMVRENYVFNFGQQQLNYLNPEEATFSSRFARFITDANAYKIMEESDRARIDISRNASSKIVLFDYVIKLILLIRQ